MTIAGIIYIWVTILIQQLLLLLPVAQARCTRTYGVLALNVVCISFVWQRIEDSNWLASRGWS